MNPHDSVPWYKKALRWSQVNLVETDPVSCDVSTWVEYWRKTHVQGVIVNAGGLVAFYPSSDSLQYTAKDLGDRDLFGEFVEAAKAEGLAVLARMDTNKAFKNVYTEHPEWFVIDAEGVSCGEKNNFIPCINGPFHTDYVPGLLKEIIDRYHPDGFADNNWVSSTRLTGGTICHCEHCQKAFKADYGLDLPVKPDPDAMTYKKWVKWNYEIRVRYWEFLQAYVRETGGPDCVWTGMMHVDPVEARYYFHDLKAIGERSDFLLLDHQGRYNRDGMSANSMAGKIIHDLAGWDKTTACCMATYVSDTNRFRHACNPPEETRLWMLEGINGGLSPWVHHIGGAQFDRRQNDIVLPVMKWHRDHDQYLQNLEPVVNVGLVWSGDNIEFYGLDKMRDRFSYQWNGFKRALIRKRIPFKPIHADHIKREAADLDVLILPNLAAMSDDQCQSVVEFVEAGGSLVMTGMTATLNEWGDKRQAYPLKKITGIEQIEMPADWERIGRTDVFASVESHNYMWINNHQHPVLKGFDNTDILPFGGVASDIKTDGSLQTLAAFVPPSPFYPPELSWLKKAHTDRPVILAGEHRSGGRIVYFSSDIDRCYGRGNLPDHGDLLANAIEWGLKDTVHWTIQGPGLLDCNLYRQANRLILQIVNLSGQDQTSGFVEEHFPVGPLDISIQAGDLKLQSAYLTVADKPVKLETDDTWTRISIERVVDHEMVIIE